MARLLRPTLLRHYVITLRSQPAFFSQTGRETDVADS